MKNLTQNQKKKIWYSFVGVLMLAIVVVSSLFFFEPSLKQAIGKKINEYDVPTILITYGSTMFLLFRVVYFFVYEVIKSKANKKPTPLPNSLEENKPIVEQTKEVVVKKIIEPTKRSKNTKLLFSKNGLEFYECENGNIVIVDTFTNRSKQELASVLMSDFIDVIEQLKK